MSAPDHPPTSPDQGWAAPGAAAAEALRLLTRQAGFLTPAGAPPPSDVPALRRETLDPQVRALVDGWEAAHPGERLKLVRLLAAGTPGADPAVGAEPLPTPDRLVAFTVCETVMDSDRVEVRSQVLLAARAAAED